MYLSTQQQKSIIMDQKKEPMEACIRNLKRRNIRAAVKQWRILRKLSGESTETLISDMGKIIDESYQRNSENLAHITDFIHKCVSKSDRLLKEAAYDYLIQEMESGDHFSDKKIIPEILEFTHTMKIDLQDFYNSSTTTEEIVNRLPETLKYLFFEKVKLILTARGMLRAGTDRKVTLIPEDSKYHLETEVLWEFEFDRAKSDGTFYIKNEETQKYLITVHEGFNSYGFSKQSLLLTRNKKQSGTAFKIEGATKDTSQKLLIRSVLYNGYLTWKSNIQTIYGDDDSYFVLLDERLNGPSPYWHFKGKNE